MAAVMQAPASDRAVRLDRKALQSALRFAGRAVPRRAIRPVLAGVRIDVRPFAPALVTGTDLEVTASAEVDASYTGEGWSVVLPKVQLDKALRSMRGPDVVLTDTGAVDFSAIVSSGAVSLTIAGFCPDDFPVAPNLDDVPEVRGFGLQESFRFAAGGAADGDTARALLRGVEVTAARCLATDGFHARYAEHRIAPDVFHVFGGLEPMVVPAHVAPYMADMPGELGIAVKGLSVRFTVEPSYGGRRSLTARRLDGRYFDVMSLVPKTFATWTTVDGTDLVGALAQALTAAPERPHPVRARFGEDGVRLEVTGELRAQIEVAHTALHGPAMDCVFNAEQLGDDLRAMAPKDGGRIMVELSGPKSLARFTMGGDMSRQVLLMPLEVE
jgi:DNA polymerase III sliding clamp (beta) subunit (PCNA family)